jgi:hypothetical protein
MFIKALAVAAFPLLLLAHRESASAQTVTTVSTIPLNRQIYVEAEARFVTFAGTVRMVATVTFDADGGGHASIQCDSVINGTGPKTGQTYKLVFKEEHEFGFRGALPAEISLQCNGALKGLSSGERFSVGLPQKASFVINPDGSVSGKLPTDAATVTTFAMVPLNKQVYVDAEGGYVNFSGEVAMLAQATRAGGASEISIQCGIFVSATGPQTGRTYKLIIDDKHDFGYGGSLPFTIGFHCDARLVGDDADQKFKVDVPLPVEFVLRPDGTIGGRFTG